MVIIGGVLMLALLVAVIGSVGADFGDVELPPPDCFCPEQPAALGQPRALADAGHFGRIASAQLHQRYLSPVGLES